MGNIVKKIKIKSRNIGIVAGKIETVTKVLEKTSAFFITEVWTNRPSSWNGNEFRKGGYLSKLQLFTYTSKTHLYNILLKTHL
jgi:hypothetical protein